MVVAFIIAAVPPILLHSASNADNLLQRSSNKYLRDEGTENGYWFSYAPDSSCQKCNCSVTVTTEMSNRDPIFPTTLVLNVNKSDCKYRTSLGRDCTCYGYPDYFIGTMSVNGFINGSMGDSWCIGVKDLWVNHPTFLNCHGGHRSETIIYTP